MKFTSQEEAKMFYKVFSSLSTPMNPLCNLGRLSWSEVRTANGMRRKKRMGVRKRSKGEW